MTQLCTNAIVIDILQAKVGVPATTPDIDTVPWEELGVESLGLSETFASLEHMLQIEISYQDALQTRNVSELVSLINTTHQNAPNIGYIRNAVLIEAPVDEVLKMTNNVREWPSLFTEYESSEVIAESQDTVTFRLTTRPDENGNQWSWIAQRQTNVDRRSTYSERQPSSGPFEHMVIRWWYDQVDETRTVMTWEQEFTLKVDAPVSESTAIKYLNAQTQIQQQVIKKKVEQMWRQVQGSPQESDQLYRGLIVGYYDSGSEAKITDAFKHSDETELPHLIGVKSRHVWVIGNIYIHFVEGETTLPAVLKSYAQHPLFKAIKAELDVYVHPLSPELAPGVAKEIYRWTNTTESKDARHTSN